MFRLSALCALAAAAATAGCAATMPVDPAPQPAPSTDQCDAGPVQTYVGKKADAATGTAIRNASGAVSLRWGAPETAWTMDYRMDRVNVRYGYDMVITEITCG